MTSSFGERGQAARQRLLTAAIDELVEQGDLEVAAVARRAGTSVGLPYRYFGSRSGLLGAVLTDFYDRLDDAVMERKFPGDHWMDREHARLVAWVNFLYDDPLTPLALGRGTGDGEVAGIAQEHLRRAISLGTRNMAHGQRNGDVPADRDPALLAAAVLGGVHITVVSALTAERRPDRQAVIAELWRFIAGAIGRPEYALEGAVQ
ncbi:MAG TPA: TetR/AcrR family transcriptional regulator [Aeromicrobium sp.]|nr:TetR/AcrR family transcriptional regulator [Aeromicrobium sp.]